LVSSSYEYQIVSGYFKDSESPIQMGDLDVAHFTRTCPLDRQYPFMHGESTGKKGLFGGCA